MKKLLVFLLLYTCCSFMVKAAPGKATINCTVSGKRGSGLYLYQLKDGEAQSLGFKRPDDQGMCKFVVNVKEGVYFFRKAGVKGNDFNHVIYLKAGDQKNVNLYAGALSIDYDSCIVQNPNIETKKLTAWLVSFNQYCASLRKKPTETHTLYKEFEVFASSFLKKNKTANVYFNNWLTDKINTDLKYLMAANYFRFGARLNSSYDSTASSLPFYKRLENKKIICDPTLLRSEHGLEMMNYVFGYWKFNKIKNTKELITTSFSEYTPLICNDQVKVAYLANKMKNINKYEDFLAYVQPYKSLFVSEDMKAAYQQRYEDLYLFATGTQGYNFELLDVNEKAHRLSDFKGKVVIIDLWAMWCGPCLAEKPVMAKIEHEFYKDRNDIVFIGISVDGLSRRSVWKNFVTKNGFKSLELLSDATSSIHKYYKVEGIPRFLIFDREGKIVTVDAPRPSTPGFKKLIDQTLASAK